MIKETTPIVRFAPSPTGLLHVGGVRTALFNYLFAKQTKGKLILRIEDTDKERSKKEYEDDILTSFEWLGLSFDETHRQSERLPLHKEYLKKLIDKDLAYISKEEPKEVGQRCEVIRFRNPNKKIRFHDLIKGDIEFDTTELKDFVIAKSLDEPIFHLAVVIDDFLMGITHVIRGEDHISNTPRQILIQEALGAPQPLYAHIPLILATDRSKLSKRKHGEAVSARFYKDKGYLPEALLNFVALLGWNPGNDKEVMTLLELIEKFNFSQVQKSAAIFNVEKLDWMNKEYLKKALEKGTLDKVSALPDELRAGKDEKQIALLFDTLFEHVHRLNQIKELFDAGELDYFYKKPDYKKEGLFGKKDPDAGRTKVRLEQVKIKLESVDENNFSKDSAKNAVWDYATKEGRGEVLWPLRFALSGLEQSPDPLTLCAILGKKETLERVDVAITKLS